MRVLTLVLWFMGLVALTTGSALAETIWDVNADFSNANGNPNDAWSYGWLNNGVFQLYPTPNQLSQDGNPGWFGPLHTAPPWTDGFPQIWKNTSSPLSVVLLGQLSLHPGPDGEMSIARWTAPADCSDTAIQGQFLPGDVGIMQVGIFKNGNWASPLWGASDSGAFDLSIPVAAGDTISFGVYGGFLSGNTPLEATITIPEPSTLVLLGIGALSLLGYAWRQQRAR